MSDERLDALLVALSRNAFGMPYLASIRDYPNDPEGLKAADEKAEEDNRAALRRALEQAEII